MSRLLVAILVMLGLAGGAQAALVGRDINGNEVTQRDGNGVLDPSAVFLFDTVLNISWLRNVPCPGGSLSCFLPRRGSFGAEGWVGNLKVGRFNGWRLPAFDTVTGRDEMHSLFWDTLGNSQRLINGTIVGFLGNVGDFQGMTVDVYWYQNTGPGGAEEWFFHANNGLTMSASYSGEMRFLAVRDGDMVSTLPSAPTSVRATLFNTNLLRISFAAPSSDGSSDITGYTASCVTGTAAPVTASGSASPIDVRGLTNGSAYACSVKATNAVGTGLPSAPVNVTTANVPDAPAISTAVAGIGSASIAFTAPANNGGQAITGYMAFCVLGTSAPVTSSRTASPITVSGLTNGSTYECSVKAINAVGQGLASAPVNVTTPAATVPGAPDVRASPRNGSVYIYSGLPPSDGGSAITGYTTSCVAGTGAPFTANSTWPRVTVSGLTNGITYACSMTASNALGPGLASATVYVTPAATVPGAPTIGAATAGNGSASIAFTAPADDGGSAISGYTASCVFDLKTVTVSGTASPITVSGLTNNWTHDCSVKAINAVGPSTASASVKVKPASAPSAPTISAVTAGNGSARISFSSDFTITGYIASCVTGTAAPVTSSNPRTPITVSGLTNGSLYACSVQASNSVGLSSASATVYVTPATTVPGAPTIGAAAAGNGSASIAFTAPADDGGAVITRYTASCVRFPAAPVTASGSASPITVSGLANGGVYACSVKAINAVGSSSASATVYGNPATTVPGAPTIGAAAAGNGSASIAFTAPADDGGAVITRYTASCVTGTAAPVGAGGSASPITVSGLANGSLYACSVKAINAVGSSLASATGNVTPVAASLADIPTLSEWGLILLAGLLLTIGLKPQRTGVS